MIYEGVLVFVKKKKYRNIITYNKCINFMKNYIIYYYVGTYNTGFFFFLFCFRKRKECNVNNTKRLTFWCNALKKKNEKQY